MPGALVTLSLLLAAEAAPSAAFASAPPVPALASVELRAAWAASSASGDLALQLAQPSASDPARGDGADARRDARLRQWERALKWSTAGALVATSTLGTLVAINQPTAFGDGRCQTGHPVLGTYGCDRGLSTLHGSSGVLSVTLYTANGVLALAMPGPVGNVSAAARPWHRALTYVHLGGIAVQPILGLVAAFPQVVGMSHSAPDDRFPRDLRTAHVGIGYVVTAAYLATLALER